jgi:hypothetical protein
MPRNMRSRLAIWVLAVALLAGCADDSRQWMKVDEKYTVAEFRRDHAACTQGGKLDEACMRSKGWVDVKSPKADKPSEPVQREPPRGRPVY